MKKYLQPIEENKKYSKNNFFIDEVQLQVYKDNYYYKDEQYIENRFRKIVDAIYKHDSNIEYKETLYKLLCERKISLGGRILANVGRPELKNVCPFNCYACQRNIKPNDSIECIFEDLKIAAHILKTEGGIGFNFSHLRPRYTYIKGSGITTPGVVGFMEIYDKASEIITKGNDGKQIYQADGQVVKNKVRKGAMISILNCFSDNTEILTNKGWINIVDLISRIEKGEDIKAIDENGNENDIINPIIRDPEEIYEIELEDGTKLECTKDHKIEVLDIRDNKVKLVPLEEIDPEIHLIKVIEEV